MVAGETRALKKEEKKKKYPLACRPELRSGLNCVQRQRLTELGSVDH